MAGHGPGSRPLPPASPIRPGQDSDAGASPLGVLSSEDLVKRAMEGVDALLGDSGPAVWGGATAAGRGVGLAVPRMDMSSRFGTRKPAPGGLRPVQSRTARTRRSPSVPAAMPRTDRRRRRRDAEESERRASPDRALQWEASRARQEASKSTLSVATRMDTAVREMGPRFLAAYGFFEELQRRRKRAFSRINAAADARCCLLAMRIWASHILHEKEIEHRRAQEALRAAQHRRAAQYLFRATRRAVIRRALSRWRALNRRAVETERTNASIAVQRVWRGYTGRCRAHLARRAQSQQALDTIAALAALRAGARTQAVHRWRERRKKAAARAVQRSWRLALARRRMWRLRAAARRRAENYVRRQVASRVMQRVARGFFGRRAARRFRAKRTRASLRIQCALRCYWARKELARLEMIRRELRSAICIQRNWRAAQGRKEMARRTAVRVHRKQSAAALQIQRFARGFLGRRAAVQRREEVHAHIVYLEDSAAMIQRCYRQYRATLVMLARIRKRRQRIALEEEQRAHRDRVYRRLRHTAAISIQRHWRGVLGRRRGVQQEVHVRALARMWIARRRVKKRRAEEEAAEQKRQAAAAKLQALIRGRKARRERGKRAKEKAKLEAYEKWRQEKKEEQAATKLQCLLRAHRARVELKRRQQAKAAKETLEHGSATAIQRRMRGVATRLSIPLLATTSVPSILINLGRAHPRLATRAAAFRSSYTLPRPLASSHPSMREPFQPWLAFVREARHHPVGTYLRQYGMPVREHITGKPKRPGTRRRGSSAPAATPLPWWWVPKDERALFRRVRALVREEFDERWRATSTVQRLYRGHRGRDVIRRIRRAIQREHRAAIDIQRLWRGHQGRRRFEDRRARDVVEHEYGAYLSAAGARQARRMLATDLQLFEAERQLAKDVAMRAASYVPADGTRERGGTAGTRQPRVHFEGEEEDGRGVEGALAWSVPGTQGPWHRDVDPESGFPYYYNTETGETTWELPADLAPVPATADTGHEEWLDGSRPGTAVTAASARTSQQWGLALDEEQPLEAIDEIVPPCVRCRAHRAECVCQETDGFGIPGLGIDDPRGKEGAAGTATGALLCNSCFGELVLQHLTALLTRAAELRKERRAQAAVEAEEAAETGTGESGAAYSPPSTAGHTMTHSLGVDAGRLLVHHIATTGRSTRATVAWPPVLALLYNEVPLLYTGLRPGAYACAECRVEAAVHDVRRTKEEAEEEEEKRGRGKSKRARPVETPAAAALSARTPPRPRSPLDARPPSRRRRSASRGGERRGGASSSARGRGGGGGGGKGESERPRTEGHHRHHHQEPEEVEELVEGRLPRDKLQGGLSRPPVARRRKGGLRPFSRHLWPWKDGTGPGGDGDSRPGTAQSRSGRSVDDAASAMTSLTGASDGADSHSTHTFGPPDALEPAVEIEEDVLCGQCMQLHTRQQAQDPDEAPRVVPGATHLSRPLEPFRREINILCGDVYCSQCHWRLATRECDLRERPFCGPCYDASNTELESVMTRIKTAVRRAKKGKDDTTSAGGGGGSDSDSSGDSAAYLTSIPVGSNVKGLEPHTFPRHQRQWAKALTAIALRSAGATPTLLVTWTPWEDVLKREDWESYFDTAARRRQFRHRPTGITERRRPLAAMRGHDRLRYWSARASEWEDYVHHAKRLEVRHLRRLLKLQLHLWRADEDNVHSLLRDRANALNPLDTSVRQELAHALNQSIHQLAAEEGEVDSDTDAEGWVAYMQAGAWRRDPTTKLAYRSAGAAANEDELAMQDMRHSVQGLAQKREGGVKGRSAMQQGMAQLRQNLVAAARGADTREMVDQELSKAERKAADDAKKARMERLTRSTNYKTLAQRREEEEEERKRAEAEEGGVERDDEAFARESRAQRRIRQHHVETEFLARMALTDPEQHSRGKDLRRVGHNAYRDRKMRELGYETVPDASAVR